MSEPDYTLDHAYDAGHEAGWKHGYDEGRTLGYREGYTAGYNEAMALHQNLDVADWMYGHNQHGKGENP